VKIILLPKGMSLKGFAMIIGLLINKLGAIPTHYPY
jgi:hypothetical protein